MLYSENELNKRLRSGCGLYYFYAADEALVHTAAQKALKVLNLVIEFAILAMCLIILVMAEPKYCFPTFAMNSTATNISMKYIYFSQFLTFIILPVSYLLDIVRTALSWNDTAEKED